MFFNEFVYLLIFVFGVSVGSFLNCLIYRLEIGKKPTGNSFCPNCKHQLSVLDLVPILSYLLLRGKCRYCGENISIQYPLVEFITGILFLSTAYHMELPVSLVEFIPFALVLIIFSLLMVVLIYDLKHFIIPNKIIYPAILTTLFLIAFNSFSEQSLQLFFNHLLTGGVSFLFFLAIYLITKGKGIGFGDVRYAFFLGLFLGFPDGLVALFFSFIIGAIIGVILMIVGLKGRKDMIPFGPFLVVGTIIGFFFGEVLINLYLGFLI